MLNRTSTLLLVAASTLLLVAACSKKEKKKDEAPKKDNQAGKVIKDMGTADPHAGHAHKDHKPCGAHGKVDLHGHMGRHHPSYNQILWPVYPVDPDIKVVVDHIPADAQEECGDRKEDEICQAGHVFGAASKEDGLQDRVPEKELDQHNDHQVGNPDEA